MADRKIPLAKSSVVVLISWIFWESTCWLVGIHHKPNLVGIHHKSNAPSCWLQMIHMFNLIWDDASKMFQDVHSFLG